MTHSVALGGNLRESVLDEQKTKVLPCPAWTKDANECSASSSPRTEAMVASAVQWAEGIMRKIDKVFPDAASPQ
jgi:hypothetical protein